MTPSSVLGNKVRVCHWKKRGYGRSEQTAFGISMGKKIMHSSLDELDSRSLCMSSADDTRQEVWKYGVWSSDVSWRYHFEVINAWMILKSWLRCSCRWRQGRVKREVIKGWLLKIIHCSGLVGGDGTAWHTKLHGTGAQEGGQPRQCLPGGAKWRTEKQFLNLATRKLF